jgi:hypothetical protein
VTYQELREWVDANPFEPFRIVMTDGRAFEITHPNMLWPGRHSAMVGLPDDPAEPDVPGRHVSVSLLHIIRCEPTGPSATVPGVP